jgi:hypothetical protein
MWDADSPSLDFSERPLRVKLRNSRNEQIFSALPPITDILGGRLARLSSGGRECFYSISNIPRHPLASALPECRFGFDLSHSCSI